MLGLRYTFLHDPARQRLHDGTIDWLWAAAENASVPIAALATDSLTELGRIAARHPGLRLTIDHLGGRGGLTTLKDAAAMTHMPDLLALAKFPNVAVKATGAPGYSSEAYPFPKMQTYLRQIYDAFGPRRMFWGTDITKMPCSWRQCVTMFTEELPWLSDQDKPLSWARRSAPGGAGTGKTEMETARRVLPHERNRKTNTEGKQVAVVIGATSKWQSDGRNTLLAHGRTADDSDLPVGVRWGVGGAIAQKFAQEGFFVVLTTRKQANASPLAEAIRQKGGDCTIVELDLASQDSISAAFATIRRDAGDPDVLVYNAGYLEGRDLPPEKELLEYIPVEMFDTTQHIACRGPFLVAKEVLPAMRQKGAGSFFFSNNSSSLRGKKRMTGQSLYYPRVMMRTLAQVLTEEYSEHGVHVANVVIDGTIDSPGTRAMPRIQNRPDLVINPVKIAEAFYYLHTQDRSCWTHELQLTPFSTKPSY